MDRDCSHPEVIEGRCTTCGQCTHDVVLNGACYFCGETAIDVTVRPVPSSVVPAERLRARLRAPKPSDGGSGSKAG